MLWLLTVHRRWICSKEVKNSFRICHTVFQGICEWLTRFKGCAHIFSHNQDAGLKYFLIIFLTQLVIHISDPSVLILNQTSEGITGDQTSFIICFQIKVCFLAPYNLAFHTCLWAIKVQSQTSLSILHISFLTCHLEGKHVIFQSAHEMIFNLYHR